MSSARRKLLGRQYFSGRYKTEVKKQGECEEVSFGDDIAYCSSLTTDPLAGEVREMTSSLSATTADPGS